MFCGGKNHVYLSANVMDETCFEEYQENINSPTVPQLRFGGGGTMLRSCFLEFWPILCSLRKTNFQCIVTIP